MDRTYTIPCQKSNFKSCEGCPKQECETKHYAIVINLKDIHA